jgi:hypothetical protein
MLPILVATIIPTHALLICTDSFCFAVLRRLIVRNSFLGVFETSEEKHRHGAMSRVLEIR